ncbi:MAG: bifunctional metallophosphatase/5'-nucleotidase [Bacteroidia bacterium]
MQDLIAEFTMYNSRREFLVNLGKGAAVAAFAGIPFEIFAKKDTVKLTVLHTNDVHSHIEPFPDNDPKYAGRGGVARRAALINEIRRNEENVLLLDAGDIFQGTPYFNKYGGSLELQLMSKMGYDAATIGNHDFDNGLEGLNSQMHHAKFPFISSNYNFSDTILSGKILPYKIFEKGGLRIGVFGLGIELTGLVDPKLYGNTKYLKPEMKAAEMAHLLKVQKKCDLVVCLSHLGFSYQNDKVSDKVLAKASKNIDVFLGGHTHSFIEVPYRYRNRDGKEVLVAQTGWAGLNLGRIDFFYEKKSRKVTASGHSVEISRKSSVI